MWGGKTANSSNRKKPQVIKVDMKSMDNIVNYC